MVKMSLGNSTSQGSAISSISSSRISAYNGAISSLNSFIGASHLQGDAYNSAKIYASTVLIPLIQGAILLSEAINHAVNQLPSRYTSEVAGESLDSEVLEAQIATYQAAYSRSSAWLTSEMSKKVLNERSILRAQQSMTRNLNKIDELQEKLDKLMAFNASSPKIFDEIASLKQAVTQGFSQVTTDFNIFNKAQTFPAHNSADYAWLSYINALWLPNSGEDEIPLGEILNGTKYWLKNSQKAYATMHIKQLEKTAKNGVPQVVYMHGNKYVDALFGADKYINMTRLRKGKKYTFLLSNGKTVRNAKYTQALFKDIGYLYPEVLIKDHPINWQAVKSNLKAMTIDKGLEAMKGNVFKKITFGLSSLVSDFKAIKNAKGLGKVIPGVNLAADLFEVGEGAMQTDDLAEKNGLKQGSAEYIASQAAGIGIDSAKVGVDAAAATVGYSVGVTAATVLGITAGVAAAPVLAGAAAVAIGLAGSVWAVKLVSVVDDQYNVTKGTKKMAVKSIKAISNGMKSFGKTLRKVFG